ncbi:unnamed protein product [Rotaria socialis]|uniref:Transmembrane protein n=1 Tax=Rotaria socialis TaxID=392032 RepID=A0A820JYA5_9BILA|nr:unnamed protein product [Rotaria socialis]CAF4333170.1 unnamed protein product [Rotaria socialis]
MKSLLLLVLISILTVINGVYNPIPIGSVVISTTRNIFIMIPTEYGGNDKLSNIFTASANMSIINTIFNPTLRDLYILFTNVTNGTAYIGRLMSREQLDSTIYQLSISFDLSTINNLTSFSSDYVNRRGFLTDQTGSTKLFSMSGLMDILIQIPPNISLPIRSVNYATAVNRLFIVTDTTVYSCANLDQNRLQCCQASSQANQPRAIAFDQVTGAFNVYISDLNKGVHQVILDNNGCPIAVNLINELGTYSYLQLAVDRDLYFIAASQQHQNDNSLLLVANETAPSRPISVGFPIVALHVSYPSMASRSSGVETCFHGITYANYRIAVILAAIFGTIMGIFICFNALFCVDFFMTKSIIRTLKKQIPHNLLEDRWNKLVEEKYAKIALEKHRDASNPAPIRKSSVFDQKSPAIIPASSGVTSQVRERSTTGDGANLLDGTKSTLSAYLRRKSDTYFNRRRSDDYQRQQDPSRFEFSASQHHPQRSQITSNQNYIEPVIEETFTQHGLPKNLSGVELIKYDEDFL